MWLLTAGPTREYLDQVRFLSNASSGAMGHALAAAAAGSGHEVVLVSGPVAIPAPAGVRRIDVVSALDMLAACEAELRERTAEVLIGVAAVCDWRPARREAGKPARREGGRQLELASNPDVLATLAASDRVRLPIGFALESFASEAGGFEGAVARARAKLARKGLSALVLNGLEVMEAERGTAWWLRAQAEPEALGMKDKAGHAADIVGRCERLLEQLPG